MQAIVYVRYYCSEDIYIVISIDTPKYSPTSRRDLFMLGIIRMLAARVVPLTPPPHTHIHNHTRARTHRLAVVGKVTADAFEAEEKVRPGRVLVDVVCADRPILRALGELLVHLRVGGYRAPDLLHAKL